MKTKIPMKRKVLLQEPLEDRLLLAVDAFGLSADIAHALDDHDSSCVSHFSCCETVYHDETALVSQSLLEETAQYYCRYFADENYSPVCPMVFDDWCAYDTFTTWKTKVDPEVYQAMRDFISQGNFSNHDNIDSASLQQALEDLPTQRPHGKIMPMVFGKLPVDFDEGGLIQVMCGGGSSGGGISIPNVSITSVGPSALEEHLGGIGSGGAPQQWFELKIQSTMQVGHQIFGQDLQVKIDCSNAIPGSSYKVYTMNDSQITVNPNGTFSFPVPASGGNGSINFKIVPVDNNIVELDKNLTVSILPKTTGVSGGTTVGYTVTGTSQIVTIIDDDTLTLEKVKFLDNLAMEADPGLPLWKTDYDWVKGNLSKTNPVAYANGNNYLTTDAWFSGSVAAGLTVDVRFVAQGFPGGNIYSDWETVTTGSVISASGVTALNTFLQNYCTLQADYIEGMTLEWEICVNGSANDIRDVNGVSTNPFYVTRTAPSGPLYHTVVHVGCEAAKYQPNEQAAFDAIWGKFAGDNICIQTVKMQNGSVILNPNGKLYYYGIYDPNGPVYDFNDPESYSIARKFGVANTFGLLYLKDGCCGAWAEFFADILAVQGISSTVTNYHVAVIPTLNYPHPTNSGSTILVNIANKKLMADLNVGRHHGVLPNENKWGNHIIVKYNGGFYDPSYGVYYGDGNTGLLNFVHSLNFEYIIFGSPLDPSLEGTKGTRPGTDGDITWLITI